MTRTRRLTLVTSLVAFVLGAAAPARAQSPFDGFNPGANNDVNAIAVQADGKILVGGTFTGLGGGTGVTGRQRIGRLNVDGTVDGTFNPGANGTVFALAVQPDGKILVAGSFTQLGGGGAGTTARSRIGRLNPDGSLDTTFNPGANSDVLAVTVQPDGKILVAGSFTQLGGGGNGTTPRNRIGRINADGSLDTAFNPGADNTINTMGLEPDGQIVVGGAFTMLGGGGAGTSARNRIGRLHPNGSIDSSFNPGANDVVRTSAVQSDGGILIGGDFTMLGGGGTGTTTRNRIGRLNPDGSLDTTFNPGSNDVVRTSTLQSDGGILVGGDFTMLGGGGTGTTTRNRIGRLNPDGSLDTNFGPGANDSVFALALQPDGKILAGGHFALLTGADVATRNRIGRLHSDGSLDVDFNPGANNQVFAIAVQPDGRILVGGDFTTLGGGGAGTVARNRIARLNQDGTLDSTFNPGANSTVFAIAVQPDGKILVGGAFTTLGGGGTGTTTRNRIGRLNEDGTVDTTFNPGANINTVFTIAVQLDGKILVGGNFTALGGGTGTTVRNRIGRLNEDGTVDTAFNPGANSTVFALLIQSDRKILASGDFTALGGGTGTTMRNRIGRLNEDGTIDMTLNPGANSTVYVMAVQPDGKILLGGSFTALGGGTGTATTRNRIGRLNEDSTVDMTFNPGANSDVYTISLQSDGQILVGGVFTTLGGGGTGLTTRNRIGRLNQDGTVDATFDPGANNVVYGLALQADGKILVGGFFTGLGGGTGTVVRNRIGRLTNTAAAIQRLTVTCPGCVKGSGPSLNAAATWTRSGAGPEVERVTFDYSADGVTYVPGDVGTRVGNEWRLTRATGALGQSFYVRARGYYGTGLFNTSGSIIESIRRVNIACPTLSATPLPAGIAGVPYSTTLTTSGALGVVTFATASSLPTGVTLSSAGVLAGTPTQTGSFPLTVTATDGSSGCAGTRAYTLTINPATPLTLTPDKTSLRFGAVTTGAAFVAQTAAQVVRLTQAGNAPGTVTWTAVSNQPWLQVSPASGSGSANLSVSIVFVGGLPIGSSVTGAITLTLAGASTPAGPIAVTLNLIPNGTSASPFGFVDTPLDNTAGVTGAVPFTGWALDDVGVERVMVCRAAFGAEVAPVDPNCGGAAQIFVGFAVFIDGARTDVAALHPTVPQSTRAGWGFMVLTNMLPNQGNGTYLFYMHAQDREGQTTLLGTRTMTCANASATKPFGAIDTPTQGGPASGAGFINFGWALTPQPKIIPINGSTMTVMVDGAPLGPVDYNHERPDIEALFPGFQNTAGANGAVGFRAIDTTTLTNGLHTISWTVTDSLGVTEGIGSRFFTVVNGTGAVTAAVEGAASSRVRATAEIIAAAPQDDAPVLARRGWDLDGPWQLYGVGGAGRAVIRGEEVDRFELALGAHAGEHYTGHVRAGEALAPLPAGSQLDATTGAFTWAPGAGFIGRYDLVFVRWEGTRAVARHEVRVILAPKGSGHIGVQVVIDTPRSQQDVGQPFVLAGWAADLDAASKTGIDTLHVWAYPSTGGAPVFLGTPALGGVRPDVAAVHGDQFRTSGFGLTLQGLTPGTYDLAVFPWSNLTSAFAPPSIVHVTVR